ncbi:hypothetical protein G3T14_19460 [Methylobacterium sp. BTF04]|uniref:hypothetical protein n=1 Tax=Methylobacterium sp. BTF04 TaxID=2708300 RepID=UPI0013D16169|nr:hypothetical protein [Methylobacterium sp. BTF04]NEU14288.1 hypothetical protein [Methylobacterium sp. BTF04]
MTSRVVALIAAAVLFGSAPVSSAFAHERQPSAQRFITVSPYDDLTTGSLGVHDQPRFDRCARSSASQGNAEQPNFPVQQYGRTSGGPLC